MTKRSNVRVIDIDPLAIPPNCEQIVITTNKTKVVIKNDGASVLTSVANKHELILKRIRAFFGEEKNFMKIRPVLLQESSISLRLLDWVCTNWARHNTVILDTYRNGYKERINLYLDYKAHLKAYSKRSFDPFCRRERIMLRFESDPEKRVFVSTTAQMNFFRWAVESGVLDYCHEHIHRIEKDMVSNLHVRTEASSKVDVSRSNASSITAIKPCPSTEKSTYSREKMSVSMM
jgi:hypothetical protein